MAKNLDKVLEQVTLESQNALGDNLISLVLYGSQARDDATAKSDVNLFLVVRDGSVPKLEPLLKLVPGWIKQSVTPPVILEQEQFSRSLDTFALEFLEMAAARKVLAGPDPFADFVPDWQAVRWDLEQEAREKTIALQRRWLVSANRDKVLRAILIETAPGFFTLLRGTLHLQRKNMAPISNQTILDGTIHWPDFNPQLWRRVWETSKSLHFPSTSALRLMVRDYVEQARLLVRYVDEMASRETA